MRISLPPTRARPTNRCSLLSLSTCLPWIPPRTPQPCARPVPVSDSSSAPPQQLIALFAGLRQIGLPHCHTATSPAHPCHLGWAAAASVGACLFLRPSIGHTDHKQFNRLTVAIATVTLTLFIPSQGPHYSSSLDSASLANWGKAVNFHQCRGQEFLNLTSPPRCPQAAIYHVINILSDCTPQAASGHRHRKAETTARSRARARAHQPAYFHVHVNNRIAKPLNSHTACPNKPLTPHPPTKQTWW